MTRSIHDMHSSSSDGKDRLLVQRKCATCGSAARDSDECSECAARHAQRKSSQQSSTHDAYEDEADHIAEQVTGGGSVDSPHLLNTSSASDPGFARIPRSGSSGQPLDERTRADMEQRFSRDFSQVRIHANAQSDTTAKSISARAYTAGRDIHFARGEFRPQHPEGRRLLAHELTHTVQQGAGLARIQRAPAVDPDPLCSSYDHSATESSIDAHIKTYASDKEAARQPLIRALKLVRRCATATQMDAIKLKIETGVGADAAAIWDESGTAFGGYTGFRPGFAPDIGSHLNRLGVTDVRSSRTFELTTSGAQHKKGAKATAKAAIKDLARTDILYFRGHQYAQYRAPGLFADGDEQFGFDLRYIEQVGGFSNVKLLISTSCATLCTEALQVFTTLFPNAVILGYRKSAPINGGAVRDAFGAGIKGLKKPLLIDQPVDVSSIISVWRSVIEAQHKNDTHPVPGYYQGGKVQYWDGKAWGEVAKDAPENTCRRKGDFLDMYPNP